MGVVFLGNELHTYHIVTLVLIVSGIVCCSSRHSVNNRPEQQSERS